ncbi:hypothetical protein ZWY2020_001489 [Hordeum vulgare]|nr:hypothetical protein ZWY2020_001489 [Hordeum vulgare]
MRSIGVALRKLAMVPVTSSMTAPRSGQIVSGSCRMRWRIYRQLLGLGVETQISIVQEIYEEGVNLFKKARPNTKSRAIKDIKEQVQEVADRRDRYKIDDVEESLAATTSIDPRLMTQFKDHRELVGIEEGSGVDFGSLENLPRLEKIDVDFHIIPALGIDLSQSNASLKHAVEIHPNHPTLTLKIVAGVPYWTETR